MPETATATAAASIPNSWKATHPDDEDDDDYVRFGEERDDFMMRFVDDTCQGIFPSGDGPCIGMLPGCEARLDHQMDLLTHCRQPFLSFFKENESPDGVSEMLPTGGQVHFVVPASCEYCGAEHTSQCNPDHCTRPQLYFQKKRPPFCKPNASLWDPVTDHAKEPEKPKLSLTSTSPPSSSPPSSRPQSPLSTSSWVPGFLQYSKSS